MKSKKAHIGITIAVLFVLMLFFAIFLEPSFFKGLMMGLYIASILVCGIVFFKVCEDEKEEVPAEGTLSVDHAKELLNNVINHISVAETTNATLSQLIGLGFTKEDLLEFNFSKADIEYAFAEYESDPEPDC